MTKAKRKLYKHNRQLGMSRLNAGLSAGFPLSIVSRREILSPLSKASYNDLFERAGMTKQERVAFLIRGMNAERVFVDKDGREHSTPDWGTRLKACEKMLLLTGDLAETKKEEATTNFIAILQAAQDRARSSRIIVRHEEEKIEYTPSEVEVSRG
ncbi:MAG: hypothetical protein EOM59_10755 [Clostridia bacterium]|nr:hypothetical protein [Clostridia bacterium]